MSDTVSAGDLLARLEALTARLDEQASQLVTQTDRISLLEAENARLTTAMAPQDTATVRPSGLVTSRRGMLLSLLGTGAAVTALSVASKPTPVAASHEGPVLLGHANLTNGTTQISRYANVGYGLVVYAPVAGSYAVYGQGAHTGLYGLGASYGVFATSAGVGVYGNGDGTAGVWGNTSGSGAGVRGVSAAGDGVRGSSNATSGSYAGVWGYGNGVPGVRGISTSGHGVHASSNGGPGDAAVYGETSGYAVDAIRGYATGQATYAMYGQATGSGSYGGYFTSSQSHGISANTDRSDKNYAGVFFGNVYISGSYTATGAKSASVKKRNGTHVRMYCQEAPEPWFEDFGTAELKNGRAEVALDPEFDEVVKGDDYRVFLTPVGVDCGLYVSRKGPHRFEVRSVGGTPASGTFDYRVVARRLDDVGKRLEKIDVPPPPERLRPDKQQRDAQPARDDARRDEPQLPAAPKKPEGIP